MERRLAFLIGGLFFVSSSLFLRNIRDAFDLSKATLMWIFLPAILVFAVATVTEAKKSWRSIEISSMALIGAILLATVTSHDVWLSILGQTNRYTGALTLIFSIAVFLIVSNMVQPKNLRTLYWTIFSTLVPLTGYLVVQLSGSDPFSWFIGSFGVPVFSTVGNPNTASGVISCLVPFALGILFSSRQPSLLRLLAAVLAASGSASVGVLSSFQGTVVILLSALCFGIFVWTTRRSDVQFLIFVLILASTSASALSCDSFLQMIFWIFVVASLSVLSLTPLIASRDTKITLTRQATRLVILSLSLGTVLVISFSRSRISGELANGFIERGDFYRAALRAFQDFPLLGTGLETFGEFFTIYRSESHALRLEESRSGSVHSIPLAMFQSGGLLLGVAYLLFAALTAKHALGAFKRIAATDPFDFAASTAWLCITVQSLVSVEHPSLYFLYFLISGLVVAMDRGRRVVSVEVRKRVASRKRRSSRVPLVAAVILTFAFVPLATRPFRSQAEFVRASELLQAGDGQGALGALDKAVSLNGRDFINLLQRGEVYRSLGDVSSASEDALKATLITNYSAGVAITSAKWLAENGSFSEAADVLVEAVKRDPYAQSLRAEALSVLTQIESYLKSVGNSVELQGIQNPLEFLKELSD